jgi:5-methyltetrahydrofolate--homocysteine methyltransferase
MGTLLRHRLRSDRSRRLPDPVDALCLKRPGVVAAVHADYLDAGADLIGTNTFNAHPVSLAAFGLADLTGELNYRAAVLAREVAAAHASPERPRWVAGVMGPPWMPGGRGSLDVEAIRDGYLAQAAALVDGGADLLLVETVHHMVDAECALLAIGELERAGGARIPVVVSATIAADGAMLDGCAVNAFSAAMGDRGVLAVGLNCSTGPAGLARHLEALHEAAGVLVSCCPSAGLPDGALHYPETPASFAAALGRFIDAGWVNLVGGCCGTTPEYVRLLADRAAGRRPRRV